MKIRLIFSDRIHRKMTNLTNLLQSPEEREAEAQTFSDSVTVAAPSRDAWSESEIDKVLNIALKSGGSVADVEAERITENTPTPLSDAANERFLRRTKPEDIIVDWEDEPEVAAQKLVNADGGVQLIKISDAFNYTTTGDISPEAIQYQENLTVAMNIFQENIKLNRENDWLSTRAFKWVVQNVFWESIVGTFTGNLTGGQTKASKETLQYLSTHTPEEVAVWAAEKAKEANEKDLFGFLGTNSAVQTEKLVEQMLAGGDMRGTDAFNAAMTAFDIATLGGASSLKAVRGATQAAARRTVDGVATTVRGVGDVVDSIKPTRGKGVASDADIIPDAVDGTTLRDGAKASGDDMAVAVDANDGVYPDQNTAPRSGPSAMDPHKGGTPERPTPSSATIPNLKEGFFRDLKRLSDEGAFGELLSLKVIREVAEDLVSTAKQNLSEPVADISMKLSDTGIDDWVVTTRFGKASTGEAFETAEDALDVINGDARFSVAELKGGRFYIETTDNIIVKGEAGAGFDEVRKGSFLRDKLSALFPATQRLPSDTAARFLEGEAGGARIASILKPRLKAYNKLDIQGKRDLADFFVELRDGAYAANRTAPTGTLFDELWFEKFKTQPTAKIKEAYSAIQELSDAEWLIKAGHILKTEVANGGKALDLGGGSRFVGYKTELRDIPEDAGILVIQPEGGIPTVLRKSALQGDERVFRMSTPTEDGYEFVVGVVHEGPLLKSDVLGYNVGGSRVDDTVDWYVGFKQEVKLADGRPLTLKPKSLIGAKSLREAKRAEEQINNIIKEVKGLALAHDVESLTALASKISRTQREALTKVIKANNDWRPVRSFDDLVQLSKEYKVTFLDDIGVWEKDAPINPNGETFGNGLRRSVDRSTRSDKPPSLFGEESVNGGNPVGVMLRGINNAAYGAANANATAHAVEGWAKLASKLGVEGDYTNASAFLRNTVIDVRGENKAALRYLKETQEIIAARMGARGPVNRTLAGWGDELSEGIYNLTGKKVDIRLENTGSAIMQVNYYRAFVGNAKSFLLNIGQGVVMVGASPQGLRAVLATPHVIAGLGMSGKNLKGWAKVAAREISTYTNISRITQEDLEGLVDFLKRSGAHIVDEHNVTESAAPHVIKAIDPKAGPARRALSATTTGAKRALDLGTAPFKYGESTARITATTTSYFEAVAKGLDPKLPSVKRDIMLRSAQLNAEMSAVSKSRLERSLPLTIQWLPHTIRTTLNLTISDKFTVGQKAGMATALAVMFGTGSKPAAELLRTFGIDPSDEGWMNKYRAIRGGVTDALLSEAFSTPVALSESFRIHSSLFDIYKALTEGDFDKVMLGPTYGGSGSIFTDISKLAIDTVHGKSAYLSRDVVNVLRNLGPVDRQLKLTEYLETGHITSKTGYRSAELPEGQGLAILLGIPAGAQELWDFSELSFEEDDNYKNIRKRVRGNAVDAMSLIMDGDENQVASGYKIWEQILLDIDTSSLSSKMKDRMRRSLWGVLGDGDRFLETMLKRAMRDDGLSGDLGEAMLRENLDNEGNN